MTGILFEFTSEVTYHTMHVVLRKLVVFRKRGSARCPHMPSPSWPEYLDFPICRRRQIQGSCHRDAATVSLLLVSLLLVSLRTVPTISSDKVTSDTRFYSSAIDQPPQDVPVLCRAPSAIRGRSEVGSFPLFPVLSRLLSVALSAPRGGTDGRFSSAALRAPQWPFPAASGRAAPREESRSVSSARMRREDESMSTRPRHGHKLTLDELSEEDLGGLGLDDTLTNFSNTLCERAPDGVVRQALLRKRLGVAARSGGSHRSSRRTAHSPALLCALLGDQQRRSAHASLRGGGGRCGVPGRAHHPEREHRARRVQPGSVPFLAVLLLETGASRC
eukprot:scaffold808_cov194-Pinguiococcus_pyrenoidosus.AAC.7